MRAICWNCRGVGGPRAVRSLNDVVRTHRPSLLGLIETKKEDGDWEFLKSKLGFRGCFAVGSQGRSGGLALLWSDDVEVNLVSYSASHIDVKVGCSADFFLTLFYGSPKVQERRESWELLRRLKKDPEIPWVVMGDFNEIAFSWEMESKRSRQAWQMRDFRSCLDDCELVDLGYSGDIFTYSNRRKEEHEVRARLDRVVANGVWRNNFPKATVSHVFANTSDHVLLVLYIQGRKLAKKRNIQRFEPMWTRHKGFKEAVRASWADQAEGGSISEKLEVCIRGLSQWSKAEFGNVSRIVKSLKDRIQQLKREPRTEETASMEAKLTDELDEWMEREELFWRQRSRAEWLRSGDRNTSYFHAKASQRKKRNQIDKLRNQTGELSYSESEFISTITNYFTDIFKSQVNNHGEWWDREFEAVPKLITEEMNERLKAPYTEGEVRRALFQMHPTKAPGLDGFPALFYQSNWSIVGGDVVKEVLNCLNNEVLDSRLNETLIVLIPKVKEVEKVEDLRPISLCKVVMKIITKILANRLKEILPIIVSQCQSAFIKGRLITDNILMAHEVSHFIKGAHKVKSGFISMKLDMSKAYERIEWHFLEKMMTVMGFAEEWIRRVMMCVRTVSYRVKINDNITEIIRPSRGLRQGDPISPYLFLICAEWLTYTINKYQEIGLIKGIKICRGAPIITHLMFADDCMMFFKASRDSLSWIRSILRRYEMVSGQKVNLLKSEVVCSKNVPETYRMELTDIMGMQIVENHSNYLGLPNGFSHRKTVSFRNIEEKVARKTRDWKHKLLSSAGREVLIKSVLQAIPIYAMSCFKIPLLLCRKLASEFLKFWWNNNKGRGIHWLRAEELFKDRCNGGMGFRKLEWMNLALLAKQGWRFLTEPNLLVSQLFKARYYPESDVLSAGVGSRPSYAWRGIVEATEIIKYGADWDANEGKYYWKRGGSRRFSVKGAYQCAVEMERARNPPDGEQSDVKETQRFWMNFWKLRLPNKIKNFGWRLYHDSLPTMVNLEKRGIEVYNKCRLCGRWGESSIHMFKECTWMSSFLEELSLPDAVWSNQCMDPGYWLWLCAKICSENDFKNLLCGLWLGWRNRNELIYGKGGWSFAELRIKLKFLLKELRDGHKLGELDSDFTGQLNEGAWLLCDGAFDQATRIGGWGVVYILEGKVEAIKAGWLEGAGSSFEAECNAIMEGFKLAEQRDVQKVRIATDSKEALWAINLGTWSRDMNLEIIKNCLIRLEEHPGWTLVNIAREKNTTADWLARKARLSRWSWSVEGAIPRDLPSLL
ncbi:unnamed protein product [Rhodiola kirilowii]